MKGKGSGFQAGHFDQGLQKKIQLVDLTAHGSQKFVPLFRGKRGIFQNSRIETQVCHRCLHLMGDIADQSLNGLFVLLALELSLVHNVVILQKLTLDPGGQGIFVRVIILRLAAGHKRVQGLADLARKGGDLKALIPVQQPRSCKNSGADRKQTKADGGSGDEFPQKPEQESDEQKHEKKDGKTQKFYVFMLSHVFPPVQI